mgnify:CR=1 FL=1
MKPDVEAFFDTNTNTVTYVVSDPAAKVCAVIDPVLDFDAAAARTATKSADKVIDFVREKGFKCEWILETHVHADHLSAAPYIRSALGGRLAIGSQITVTQNTFGPIFNAGVDLPRDGRQFDHLFADNDSFDLGTISARALHTPGHTPACMTYVIGDAAFVGDTLFMPDGGSARADFPGGDARTLYRSIKRVLALPPETRLFICHDYGPNGRDIAWETTVGSERAHNIHLRDGISEDEFVKMREARDATLSMPRLILPSLQVNMRAGEIPKDQDGRPMLKLPINAL